jgi:hypothetical protein
MKIRMGFVSNSSSSSFCIIGVDNDKILNKLMKAENVHLNYEEHDDVLCGVQNYKVLTFAGGEGECSVAGMEAESLLQTMAIPQACEHVKKEIKDKLGVIVPLNKISFIYGEICTG